MGTKALTIANNIHILAPKKDVQGFRKITFLPGAQQRGA